MLVEAIQFLELLAKSFPYVTHLSDSHVEGVQGKLQALCCFHLNDNYYLMISNVEGTAGYKQNIEAVSLLIYDTHFIVMLSLRR